MPGNANHETSAPDAHGAPPHQVIPFPRSVEIQPGVDTATVDPALARLYGNLYASVPQFLFGGALDDCHTYTVHQGDELHTLLVFRLRGHRAEVLNEVIPLDAADVRGFAEHVFARYPQVRTVGFRAVHAPPPGGTRPVQYYDYLEDTVIALPPDTGTYYDSLSKNTRRNVKRGQRDAADLESCAFHVYEPGQAPPDEVRAVIALNHARMAGKNKRSGLDDTETRRILALVEKCGLVGVIKVDGVVRAGGIACRTGANYFLLVLAHDPAFDDYSLGFLCCYYTICACIERGGREFHFLWGRYAYKQAFRGELRELYRIVIYRSRWAMLRHAGLAAETWRRAMMRRAMLWLHARRQQPTPAFAVALRLLARWRQWRHPAT